MRQYRILLAAAITLIFVASIIHSQEKQAVPEWAQKTCQKVGESWQYSGSVHGISVRNIAVALARNDALTNLATSIGVTVRSATGHKIEGSELDGYTEEISVVRGNSLDRIAAYGVRQKEIFIEEDYDRASGRQKYDAYVLLEVTDADLQRAKQDYERSAVVQYQKPIMKSKEEGVLRRIIKTIGF